MASVSETGHAKNVANFEDLISFCKGYGEKYNPSNDSYSIAKLLALEQKAKDILEACKVSNTSFNKATDNRQLAFDGLEPLATRIVNGLIASGASALAVAGAKTINRKIQGAKTSSPAAAPTAPVDPNNNPPEVKTISTSQKSYDSLIDHFRKLIEEVSQEKLYKPNEADLKTEGLQAKLKELQNTNTALINSYTDWSNNMLQRNEILYNELTGLVKTALGVKSYIKSIYSATSPQYKHISGIPFKVIKVKK